MRCQAREAGLREIGLRVMEQVGHFLSAKLGQGIGF
jgi:hypothetical protein